MHAASLESTRDFSRSCLTHEDMAALARPFPLLDHKFNPKGLLYIKEPATNRRLSEVDPSWELRDIVYAPILPGMTQISCTGRMIVKGVSREGAGSSDIGYGKDVKRSNTIVDGKLFDIYPIVNEPWKSGPTDLLRRLGRLFWVGLYLNEIGGLVRKNNWEDLDHYLRALNETEWSKDAFVHHATHALRIEKMAIPATLTAARIPYAMMPEEVRYSRETFFALAAHVINGIPRD